MSTTEKEMLTFLAPFGVQPCQSFEPYYQSTFTDKEGTKYTALPDGIFHIKDDPTQPLMIEVKGCLLNSKTTYQTAYNGLRAQYAWKMGNPTGMSHNALSVALWNAEHYKDCLNNAWNHSRFKHAVVSNALPLDKYIVVFTDDVFFKDDEKTIKAFKAYAKLGINCMALSQVSDYLASL